MATDFQNKATFEAQIRECYGRVCWSHKIQEKCADILNNRLKAIKLIQIIITAIITTGILVSVFGGSKEIGIFSAALSVLLFGLNTYTKDYDLGELAQKHTHSAVSLWDIREKYLSLLTDLKSDILSNVEAREIRDELQNQLSNIYKGAPRTITKAYDGATKALKKNEELTFSNEEIDLLLPEELRKNK